MARAPLRPVPGLPAQPVSDADAVELVGVALPALPERERTALALTSLSGTPRDQVAARLDLDELELSECLARARKELRRSVAPLAGAGWCERAERMISDRIDAVLADGDTKRLDVHLRNCPRCVEHERRLVQATDALVAGIGGETDMLAPLRERRAATARSQAPAASEGDAERTSTDFLRALPLSVLIAVTVLLALAALALAFALGTQL